jgi:hypothetical protein
MRRFILELGNQKDIEATLTEDGVVSIQTDSQVRGRIEIPMEDFRFIADWVKVMSEAKL